MGRTRGSWRVAIAAALCLIATGFGASGQPVEAFTRPRATWNVTGPVLDLVTCPRATYDTATDRFDLGICLGQAVTLDATVTADLDVNNPKLVLQTPSGARILRIVTPVPLGATLTANTPFTFQIVVDVPPTYRNSRASGRLYLADRGSVLVAPFNVRAEVKHPTPADIALTPVITPSNNIKLLRDRFNIRVFTVINRTNITYTNADTIQHQVFGTRCQNATGACNPIALPAVPTCNTVQPSTYVDCLDTGPMNPQEKRTIQVTRPVSTQAVRYRVDDRLTPYAKCAAPTFCYLTVK